MNISVRVIPGSKRVEVKSADGALKVYLTKPAVEGKANAQLIEVLADYFKLRKYQIKIKQGSNSRNKIVFIEDAPANRSKDR
jgi:uncharacterized protein